MADMGFMPQVQKILYRIDATAPDDAVLGDARRRGEAARRPLPARPRVSTRSRETEPTVEEMEHRVLPRPPDGQGEGRRRRSRRGVEPHARVHAHQARRRPARHAARARGRARAARSTATCARARASARWPTSRRARCRCSSPPTSRRAASTSTPSTWSSTTTRPRTTRRTCTVRAAPPAPGESGVAVTLHAVEPGERRSASIQRRLGLPIPVVEVFSNDPRLADLATGLETPSPSRSVWRRSALTPADAKTMGIVRHRACAPWAHEPRSRAGSAPSPSRPRWRSTPRPRRCRPRARTSSASAPASPTSRRPPHIVEAAVAACASDPRTTSTRRAAGLPELRAAIAAKTARDSGYDVERAARSRHQRRQARGLQHVPGAARPRRRGAAARAVLDHVPRGDRARRRRVRRAAHHRGSRASGSPSSSSKPRARRARRRCCSCRRATRPARCTRRDEVEAIGRWAVEHGIWVVTDEIYEHLTYGDHRVHVDAGRSCPSSPTRASCSTASPRPTR